MVLAYYDGKLVEKESVKISPFDFGFARGMSLFEFSRIYGGIPFRLEDHIQRFAQGAKAMGMPMPLSAEQIFASAKEIISRNKFEHSGIKFYLTMGECGNTGGYGFKNGEGFTPHFMMIEEAMNYQHPEAPYGMAAHERGVALKPVPFSRQISEAKSINYSAGFTAVRNLRGTDFDEILYVHPQGYVTETTTSNFFCVIDGNLHTPAHEMLQGITKKVIFELANELKIPVIEKDLSLEELRFASEAFITGSFIEMMPVRQIEDITYPSTMDAPVFAKLRKAFTSYISTYCKERQK